MRSSLAGGLFFNIMARIRYIKPEFFKDDDLAQLPFEVRLFYAGLWGLADKAGRLEDRPMRLKAEIFPYDNVDAEKCLKQLNQQKHGSGKPFINRYEVDGQRYIQILLWDKHQRPHHTEKDSQIPAALLITKGTEKGAIKGTEKHVEASATLSNGSVTVTKPPNDGKIEDFEVARKLYPGTKRGKDTEFVNYKKKHKDWGAVTKLLRPAIELQIKWRENANGDFRPDWKNFSTWINNRCWEDEPNMTQKGSHNGRTKENRRNFEGQHSEVGTRIQV